MEKQNLAVTIFLIIFLAVIGSIGVYGAMKHPLSKSNLADTKQPPQQPTAVTKPEVTTPEPTPAETPTKAEAAPDVSTPDKALKSYWAVRDDIQSNFPALIKRFLSATSWLRTAIGSSSSAAARAGPII